MCKHKGRVLAVARLFDTLAKLDQLLHSAFLGCIVLLC